MAVLYAGVEDHPYLSGKAKALSEEKREQEQILAESLLELDEPLFTVARDVAEVLLAIVMQINFQVEMGIDPFYKKAESSSQSKQSAVYRDNVMIDPRAWEIVQQIKARTGIDTPFTRYGTLVSLRTND